MYMMMMSMMVMIMSMMGCCDDGEKNDEVL